MKTNICPECGAVNTIDRDICFKCEVLLITIPVESKKNTQSVFGWIIGVLIVFGIIGVFAAIAIPSGGGGRKRSRQNACIANIKMLENALEMYDMDTPPVEEGVTSVVCSDGRSEPASKYGPVLQTGGYVQRLPKCPTSNSFDAYSVHREGASVGYAMYVSCSVHGTISASRGR